MSEKENKQEEMVATERKELRGGNKRRDENGGLEANSRNDEGHNQMGLLKVSKIAGEE